MIRANYLTALVGAGAALAAMNAQAQLVSTDGGLGVYDPTANVTWTSDANLFYTQENSYSGGATAFVSAVIADSGGVVHVTPSYYAPTGTYTLSAGDFITSSGQMDWWGAQAWVHYLDVTDYGGSNLWALPTTVNSISNTGAPDGAPGDPLQSSSQMAGLFYGDLGQVKLSSITTTHNASYSLFSNVQSIYWSGTELSPGFAWEFTAGNGYQSFAVEPFAESYALAVSPGDVSAVPEPGTAWLLGMGLLALVSLGRRKAETLALT